MVEPESSVAQPCRLTTQPYILVGGLSSRFGSHKAFAKIEERRQIDRLVESLTSDFKSEPVLVCSKANQSYFKEFDTIDDLTPSQGPMSGTLAVLQDLARSSTNKNPAESEKGRGGRTWAMIVQCDLFRWNPTITDRLLATVRVDGQQNTRIAAFLTGDYLQPLPSLWQCSLASAIAAAEESGSRSMVKFLQARNDLSTVAIDESLLQSFNTPEELVRLRPNAR